MTFKDGTYNTAAQKEKIYNQWKNFLKNNCQEKFFHKDLYKHLCLHFGFIAHYNQAGFYIERFDMSSFDDFTYTFKTIINAPEYYFHDDKTSGNADLNLAIREEAKNYWSQLQHKARQDSIASLEAQRDGISRKIDELKKPLST